MIKSKLLMISKVKDPCLVSDQPQTRKRLNRTKLAMQRKQTVSVQPTARIRGRARLCAAASMETQEPASLPKQKSESLTHSWDKTKLNMYFLGEKMTTLLWRLKICQGMSLPEGKPAGQHIKLASSFWSFISFFYESPHWCCTQLLSWNLLCCIFHSEALTSRNRTVTQIHILKRKWEQQQVDI